jgi:hypothetical protein
MTTTVDVEDWSLRRYQEARRVPCEITGPVRRYRTEVGVWSSAPIPWATVPVLIEGESTPRDVSICRVRVDGKPWGST